MALHVAHFTPAAVDTVAGTVTYIMSLSITNWGHFTINWDVSPPLSAADLNAKALQFAVDSINALPHAPGITAADVLMAPLA